MEATQLQNIQDVRSDTARNMIFSLYHAELTALVNRRVINEFCAKNRLHSVQYYLNEKVLNLACDNLDPGLIYLVNDLFSIYFALFSVAGIPYVFGPFCPEVPSEFAVRSILKEYAIQSIDENQLLAYCGSFPHLQLLEAQNIITAFIQIVNPDETGKIIREIEYGASPEQSEENKEIGRKHHSTLLERRYTSEREFVENIQRGNSRQAIHCLHIMEGDVAYLKQNSSLERERIGAAVACTTARHAATQAGLPPLIVDSIAKEATFSFMRAGSANEVYLIKEATVRNYCRAIRESQDRKFSALVQSVMYFIYHDYAHEISFQSLAEDLNVSESYLTSSFKKEVGVTPNAKLVKVRMEKAAHLLRNGGLSVADVSLSVGIGDPNYFVKLFKKEYGETPSAYRKKYTT